MEGALAEGLWSWDSLVALLMLSVMEIVLGVDNVIFIAILAGKLPPEQQGKARQVGLGLALIMRIGLLFGITWIMKLTTELFQVFGKGFSGRDLILLAGGLFLVWKATHEIFSKLESKLEDQKGAGMSAFGSTVAQIILLDIIFSLDSVITAVGMAQKLPIMIAAVVIAVAVMMAFSGAISRFIHRHPSMKILALAFLLLIGVTLFAEGLGQHVAKGTIYFAMAFSAFVEVLNLRLRTRTKPVELHEPVEEEPKAA